MAGIIGDLQRLNIEDREDRDAYEAAVAASKKHLNDVVYPAENSWYSLRQVIRDPNDIEKMSSDHRAIAAAIEEVATMAPPSPWSIMAPAKMLLQRYAETRLM